jgi:nucleoside-diphosphate-sugar epimerase
VLVTGGTGFIGRYLVERLAALGHPVTVLDLAPPAPGAPVARAHVGDVRDPAAVRDAMVGCEAVFHLAAAHHDYGLAERTYFDVNETGSRIVCDAMDAAGVREVCFYSSVAVFGDAPAPHHEDAPTAPVHPYGASKLAGERVFAAWAARGAGRRVLVIRPTITFGPGNVANMYALIRQIRSRLFAQVGPGRNVKSLSYVENLVGATLYLWNLPGRPPTTPITGSRSPTGRAARSSTPSGARSAAARRGPPSRCRSRWRSPPRSTCSPASRAATSRSRAPACASWPATTPSSRPTRRAGPATPRP